jgi:glucose-6-phosphate 1-dehydrogenase
MSTTNTLSDPSIFIIFGATGDLASRKIAPALYNLFLEGYLPQRFSIIGTSHVILTEEQFKNDLRLNISKYSRSGEVNEKQWTEFSKKISYQIADVNDSKSYKEFDKKIAKLKKGWGSDANVLFYLAVAPNFFPVIASGISVAKLAENTERARIIIEKPFGHDLETAKVLNKLLANLFEEKQIYRIDHYLGKETVQNIMAFRFANSIMEPLWNRSHIEHVQISVSEQLGVEGRGGYYNKSGALRDMVQNHLLQLLCTVAMEPPVNFGADEVRDRKVDVLKAIRKFTPEEIKNTAVRGQYGSGWMKGKKVPAYREEANVDRQSNTETFAAFKFFIDNWRWQGVPFYLRTGKRMQQSSSVIMIQFKDVPHHIFSADQSERMQKNRLIISIQPEMSIRLQVQAKRPGVDLLINIVDMVFDYKGTYTDQAPEAYETLILDTIEGDQTLFMRGDQIEAAWEVMMPILNLWQEKKSLSFPNYSANCWGPEAAEALIARDGFNWFTQPVIEQPIEDHHSDIPEHVVF